jgi:fucokinase
LPHYSAFGKLFARVSHELPDGRASTLFDEFVVSLSGVPLHMHEGVVVASGDVLLMFDHMQLDFGRQGIVGVGMRVPAEVGTRHGVFVTDRDTGRVRQFLHKPSVVRMEQTGALNEDHQVDVDTGIVWMDPEIAGRCVALAEPGEGWSPLPEGTLGRLVTEGTAVNLYGDFLGPLASEATREECLWDTSDGPATEGLRRVRERIWDKLRRSPFSMLSLRPARFVHFGSTAEYREAMATEGEAYRGLGWSERVLCSVATGAERKPLSGVVALASLVCGEEIQLGPGSVVEDSVVSGPAEVGGGCVLAGVRHTGSERLSVESDLVLHRLPVRLAGLAEDGVAGVVSRLYGVLDSPKTPLSDGGATFLNRPWRAWLDAAAIPEQALWGDRPPEECTLWNARLYPLASDSWASWKAVAWMQRPEQATEEEKEGWRHGRRLSLEESYLCADLERVVSEAGALEDEIRAKRFLQAIREEQFSQEAAVLLGERPSMVRRRVERVIGMSEGEKDALLRMRGWKSTADSLARVAGEDEEARTWADSLEEKAFGTLAELIRSHTPPVHLKRASEGRAEDVESSFGTVVVEAPARVDFGGGWSDTPPYSIELGGTVLNAAVELNGRLPIRVEAEFRKESGLWLESVDLGVRRRLDRPEDVLEYGDPSDPLALHKAALVLSGLHEHADGGLRLSTEVAIPKGSGLGTSSIIAGAVLAALNRLMGHDPGYEALFDQVFCLEQMLTTGGGWQDQVGGLVGGVKLVTTKPGLPQTPKWTPVPLSDELRERFVLVYTGQRRLAKGILRAIMGRYMSRDPVVVGILKEIQDIARTMRDVLLSGDLEMFGKLMTRHWIMNKEMDPGSTNPFIDRLFEQFDPYIVGGKLVGAGGGGFAEVIAKDSEAARDLALMLERTYPEGDVRVWPCRVVERGLVG